MSKTNLPTPPDFPVLLKEIKNRIQQAQSRAVLAVNAELVQLYWNIGKLIDGRQSDEGWGAAVIPRLSNALKNELPELKGFSERNIKRMLTFYRTYPDLGSIVPPAVAQLVLPANLPAPVAKSAKSKVPPPVALSLGTFIWTVPWSHHIILMEKVKDLVVRAWYMQQTIDNGWSRDVLSMMIKSGAHLRQGKTYRHFRVRTDARFAAESEICSADRRRNRSRTRRFRIGSSIRTGGAPCTEVTQGRKVIEARQEETTEEGPQKMIRPEKIHREDAKNAKRENDYGKQ